MRTMYILLLLLLFLVFEGSNANKQGDFGIFSACLTKNDSVRLDCYYAPCPSSPSFDCTFTVNGVVLYKAANDMCKLVLPDQYQNLNVSLSYNCTLIRKERRENKNITINPLESRKRTSVNQRGKTERIKACPGTTGLHLHQAPSSLWPVVTLSLWRVLVTDSHAT